MNKIWLYITATVLLFALCVTVLVIRYVQPAAQTSVGGSLPTTGAESLVPNYPASSGTTPQPSGTAGGVMIASYAQGTVSVRDFLKDPDVVAVTPVARGNTAASVFYSLGSLPYEMSASIATSSMQNISSALERGYEIAYSQDLGVFSVFIYKEPIGEMRQKMADDLAARLGLAPQGLCDLVSFVWVSPLANKLYAAKNIGFPGCPGATLLPGG